MCEAGKHDMEECVKRLSIQPNEALVFRFVGHLSPETKHRIHEEVARLFPGIKGLVLDDGASVEVLEAEMNRG